MDNVQWIIDNDLTQVFRRAKIIHYPLYIINVFAKLRIENVQLITNFIL